jgi:hypothetical protein
VRGAARALGGVEAGTRQGIAAAGIQPWQVWVTRWVRVTHTVAGVGEFETRHGWQVWMAGEFRLTRVGVFL